MQLEIKEKSNMDKLRNLGKNILLLFLSLVVSLSIMEIVLRFYNPLGFRIKGNKIILPPILNSPVIDEMIKRGVQYL